METPTVVEIQNKILTDFKNELKIEAIMPNSVLYVLSYVLAGALYGVYFFADKLISNLFLDTTTKKDTILRWGDFLGIPKKNGSPSKGEVTFTGTGSVPKETILTNTGGDRYRTLEGVSIAGAGEVKIEAMENGMSKNLSTGGQLLLQGSILGIDTIATVAEGGLKGGADEEHIEDYRQRLLQRVRTIQTGGNRQDYINWVSEVDGVGKVFVLENYDGIGKVGITCITDDRTALIPNEELTEKVKAAVEANKPLGSIVSVFKPKEGKIKLKINLTPNTPLVQERVRSQLQEMFKINAEVAGTVYRSKISEAISLTEGEDTHSIIEFRKIIEEDESETREIELEENGSETKEIKLKKNEIATLGEIEWIG